VIYSELVSYKSANENTIIKPQFNVKVFFEEN